MSSERLEAFSDGVIAIIITIMVLELKAPNGESLNKLAPLVPIFFSYMLSFVNVGIYWNNHHHMLHAADKISGQVLWANLHLLFWLSLFPFVTAWMGENRFAMWPVAIYGVVSLMSGVAYYILARALLRCHGESSPFAAALGSDLKGKSSLVIYATAIGSASSIRRSASPSTWLLPRCGSSQTGDSRTERRGSRARDSGM
jgi:uncharacterized membrane protein